MLIEVWAYEIEICNEWAGLCSGITSRIKEISIPIIPLVINGSSHFVGTRSADQMLDPKSVRMEIPDDQFNVLKALASGEKVIDDIRKEFFLREKH